MSRTDNPPPIRPARLPDGSALDYAPENEQGVVFLFSQIARQKYGLRIERIRNGYPDCIAYRGSKRIRIEFEYRAKNFVQHRHDPKECDWVVCWINDWTDSPSTIQVHELRRLFGLGFNVWFEPVRKPYSEELSTQSSWDRWSVPSQAIVGDLVLYYRTAPDCYVRDLYRVDGEVRRVQAGYKDGKDWMAPIRRVCQLDAPLHLSELQSDRVVSNAGFVRGKMRTGFRASDYWDRLFQMIVSRNHSVLRSLRKFGPDRIS